MFLKKSLLFTTALALLMFAGQASAQPGVSFTHVPGEGGTAGMASGTDAIVVQIEVTGVSRSASCAILCQLILILKMLLYLLPVLQMVHGDVLTVRLVLRHPRLYPVAQ